MQYVELQQDENNILTMCMSCGCIVGDTVLHDNFHKQVNNAMRLASSAFDGAYSQGSGRY